MATPERGLPWWDREFDDLGSPIRSDVRAAAPQVWPDCCARTNIIMGDSAEAPEIMEESVSYISKLLNRSGATPPLTEVKRLLSMNFCRRLHRRAKRLCRIQLVGTAADLDDFVPRMDWIWTENTNLWLDFEKLVRLLSTRNFLIFLMRRAGHPWCEIGEKTGIPTERVRAAFWRAIDKAMAILGSNRCRNGDGVEISNEKRSFRAQLPPDLDPGEADLLEGYDLWLHKKCRNPERIGCPDRETLIAFALAKIEFDDDYTMDHIGLCAACLDELLDIKKQLMTKG